MSKKILAVFGATGQQGTSVITHVLNDPELSSQYHLRAITRDIHSPKANLLKSQNINVVHGDLLNPPSLLTALQDAHTVFAMTANDFIPNSEYIKGKAIADAAVSAGAKYLIWSTLPSITDQTNGKYTTVAPFDDKARVEAYIRHDLGTKIQSSFLVAASFMENCSVLFVPKFDAAVNKWVITHMNSPRSKVAFIAAVEDIGKFVGSILAEPERYEGRTVNAAQGRYSFGEIAEAIGKVMGKEVVYRQIGVEEFKKGVPFEADILVELFRYFEEFGLYGPGEEEVVVKAREDVRGGVLMGLDGFLVKYPLKLEE